MIVEDIAKKDDAAEPIKEHEPLEVACVARERHGFCPIHPQYIVMGGSPKVDVAVITASLSKESSGVVDLVETPATREDQQKEIQHTERNFFSSALAQRERARDLVKEITAKKKRSREEEQKANIVEAIVTTVEHRRPSMDINGMTYLSPLTTVGNLPFRRICKEYGADITCGEMALAHNLLRMERPEWSLLRKHISEGRGHSSGRGLFGVQIATPNALEATALAEVLSKTDFEYDFVDLNCGCPIDLIVTKGCGSALLHHPRRIRDIIQGFTSHIAKPCTIKVRIGEDSKNPTLHKWIGDIASWGVSAITIHGRSRRQRYAKEANWDYIKECAGLAGVSVVGNGDVMSYEDYTAHMTLHGVGAVMIGRGALIKPWVFQEIAEQRIGWDISSHERFEMLRRFCNYGLAHWGSDERGVTTTRRFLLEWMSFLYRYVPVGLLERLPQRMNERPPYFRGRDDLETLMGSEDCREWVKLSEMLLGPVEKGFTFIPKHKSSMYAVTADGVPVADGEKAIAHE